MKTAKGQLVPINGSLNIAKTKFGVDYRLLLGAFVVSVIVFLFASKTLSVIVFASVVAAGKIITRNDAQMYQIWCLSVLQGSYYDPGKE
jgi:type IV secretory pathway VirB3-like protein